MERNYELLKEVLSVPTKTYQEDLMVQYICDWLDANNIPFYVDEFYNVYATKKTDENVEFFPCVVAHTDTVHNIDTINVVEEMLPDAQGNVKLSLKAYNNEGYPTGIGGDDKCVYESYY
jgi:di/tripeptidase